MFNFSNRNRTTRNRPVCFVPQSVMRSKPVVRLTRRHSLGSLHSRTFGPSVECECSFFRRALKASWKARSIDLEIQAPVGLWAFHASHFHPHCGGSPAHTHTHARTHAHQTCKELGTTRPKTERGSLRVHGSILSSGRDRGSCDAPRCGEPLRGETPPLVQKF